MDEKKTIKISLKKAIIIACIIILLIAVMLYIVISKSSNKSNEVISSDNQNSILKNSASVGEKNGILYLINDSLESKEIYKFSNYYSSTYIVRNNNVYIMYDESGGNTKYVDIIDLTNGKKQKVTIDEINNNSSDTENTIYYRKQYTTYCKDLKTGKEEIDNTDSIKDNYQYSFSKDKKLIRKDLTTNQIEELYSYSRIYYDFIIGENKVYHCGDGNFYCYDLKTKNNTIIGRDQNSVNGHGLSGMLIEYNDSIYVYTDQEKVYTIDSEKNTKNTIYDTSNSKVSGGEISNISLISKDILQISVSHLGTQRTILGNR